MKKILLLLLSRLAPLTIAAVAIATAIDAAGAPRMLLVGVACYAVVFLVVLELLAGALLLASKLMDDFAKPSMAGGDLLAFLSDPDIEWSYGQNESPRGGSSMVEPAVVDREDAGSNPAPPSRWASLSTKCTNKSCPVCYPKMATDG